MEITRNRVQWVDTGKFICIMFVMLSHLQSGAQGLTDFFTPFFLAGFFFLSGYVYRDPGSFRIHMEKKARGLLWPWLLFTVAGILLSAATPGVDGREIGKRLIWAFLQIRTLGDEVWFLAALFMAFIPFYFFAGAKKPMAAGILAFGLSLSSMLYVKYVPGTWLPWGINALPWHLEAVLQYQFWMLMGYYFQRWGETVFDRYDTVLCRCVLWAAYLACVYGPLPKLWQPGGIPAEYLKSGLGILMLVALCKHLGTNGYVAFVGANTLTYFALHGRVYAVIERMLGKFAAGFYGWCLGNPWTSGTLAVVITFAVSLILMVPAEIINRWLPWVLGRKRK